MSTPAASSSTRSSTWCVLPWVHLFADEGGSLRPCCMTLEHPELVNRDPSGAPYKIYDEAGLASAWNSPFMRELRHQFLSGQRPVVCSRCFRDEDLGMTSHRQISNRQFRHLVDGALGTTTPDGCLPFSQIHSLDIRLGNRCNLKCRMCSPFSSRGILSDYALLHDLPKDDPRLQRLAGKDWVALPAFRRNFHACTANVQRLHFGGGEPLLRPEMQDLLQELVRNGRASEVGLHYVTNLTVLPESLFGLWKQFKRVGFVVSLDATGELGSYIRHPLDWPTLEQNLRALDRRALEMADPSLYINMTVQAYNILSLDRTVAYLAETLPHFGRPKLSLLYYPEHMGIRVLPAPIKQLAVQRLQALRGRLQSGWPVPWPADESADLCETLDGIVDYMMGRDRTDLLPEFRRWTRVLDRSRGEDILSLIPEFSPWFGENGTTP
jgi:hypothetical protein